MENDGEARQSTGKAPDGGGGAVSFTLLREGQSPTGASHIRVSLKAYILSHGYYMPGFRLQNFIRG